MECCPSKPHDHSPILQWYYMKVGDECLSICIINLTK